MLRLQGDQPLTADKVDELVSARRFHAELCPRQFPRTAPPDDENATDAENLAAGRCSCCAHLLTRKVEEFMIHKCMVAKHACKKTAASPCKRRFPKPLTPVSYMDDSGRWQYKRLLEEDREVVPYNPILLLLLDSHCNVDVCTGPGAARYIRKYTTKMTECTKVRVANADFVATARERDGYFDWRDAGRRLARELGEWYKSRVTSSSEAVTFLTEQRIQLMEPAVQTLRLHLPGDHTVKVDDETGEAIPSSKLGSHLARYFRRPETSDFDDVKFCDYFEKFRLVQERPRKEGVEFWMDFGQGAGGVLDDAPWLSREAAEAIPGPDAGANDGDDDAPRDPRDAAALEEARGRHVMFVRRRRGGSALARMQNVPLAKEELYAMKLLLGRHAARSFHELKGGFGTFKERAVAEGIFLLEDEATQVLQHLVNPDMTPTEWRAAHRDDATPHHDDADSDDGDVEAGADAPLDEDGNELGRLTVPRNGATAAQVLRTFILLITAGDPAATQALFERFWPYLLVSPPLRFPATHVVYSRRREQAEALVAAELERLGREPADVGLVLQCHHAGSPSEDLLAEVARQRGLLLDGPAHRADLATTLDAVQSDFVRRVEATMDVPAEVRERAAAAVASGAFRLPPPPPPATAGMVAPRVFSLLGHGGTGKTRCLRHLIARSRERGHVVIVSSFMAIAASLLPGADTNHRTHGLPLYDRKKHERGDDQPPEATLKAHSRQARALRAASLIVFDEAPMQGRVLLEAADRQLRRLRNDVRPFGGATVVMAGDFKQLLQVMPGADEDDVASDSLAASPLFRDACKTYLRKQYRVNDRDWNRFGLELGYGVTDDAVTDCPAGCDPASADPAAPPCGTCGGLGFVVASEPASGAFTKSIDALRQKVRLVTSDAAEARAAIDEASDRDMIVSFLNFDVDEHNMYYACRHRDDSSFRELPAANIRNPDLHDVDPTAAAMLTDDMMEAAVVNGVPSSSLHLWVGARVMLLRNMHVLNGLFNGQLMEVVAINRYVISVKLLDARYGNDVHHIPRIKFEAKVGDVPFTRVQFPLRLAYAITANKSQGQTLTGNIVLDLRRPSFAPGQLYVAFTRVPNGANVTLLVPPRHDGLLHAVVQQKVLAKSGDVVRRV